MFTVACATVSENIPDRDWLPVRQIELASGSHLQIVGNGKSGEPLKILHIHENLAPLGGVETYLLSLAPLLADQGNEQAYVYAKGDAQLVARAYHVPALNRCGLAAERQASHQMRAVLREWRPDVVHLHNVYNVAAVAACLDAAPVVVHGHDFRYLCPASNLFYRRTGEICQRTCGLGCFTTTVRKHCLTPRPLVAVRYYRRVRWMAKNWSRFAHVIAPSRATLQRFIQAGLPGEKGTVVPYFCPLEPLGTARTLPEQPTIVFLGRLSPVKGYDCFIRALGLLPERIQGLMIGNFTAKLEQSVRDLAANSGCVGRLTTKPWASRSEIGAVMGRATVFCFPSIWPETLGIVGLEALACGVPVVASDVGGVREWLINGETGLLVPPKDPRALANAVLEIVESPDLASRMGKSGMALVRDKFGPAGHVARLIEVYEAALEPHPQAGPAALQKPF
ncbi:MAG TPA: glycosyltransferase family 4 protein [Planctomycetaceae bacterium]|jgi:glycosyltransferase involved in cell wall biosynthesis